MALLVFAADVNALNVRRATAHRPNQARLNRVSHRLRASDPHHEEFKLIATQSRDEAQADRAEDQPGTLPMAGVPAPAPLPDVTSGDEPLPFHEREFEGPPKPLTRGRAPPFSL